MQLTIPCTCLSLFELDPVICKTPVAPLVITFLKYAVNITCISGKLVSFLTVEFIELVHR